MKKFKEIGEFKELKETLQLGVDMDPASGKMPNITLTEVAAMKLYCDIYMQYQAKRYMEGMVTSMEKEVVEEKP